ncbi:hypothetical protein IV74_GL000631 [Carnobacterium divergens DSM 20623]|uniref:Uncharacterized protein n=2 Tax=Carnobacterium divergens TaxID=2748 RepID=A0A0R2I3R4_CARDV|nr:hypothetical protein IV74_GL000631 [Carnobacterium divergens DSM 20623]
MPAFMKNIDQKKLISQLSSIYSILIILFLGLYFFTKNMLLVKICLFGLLVIAIIFAVLLVINLKNRKKE